MTLTSGTACSYSFHMAAKTLNVPLSADHERFVEQSVTSGRYLTHAEVIAEGLDLLREREAARAAAIAELRREIQVGADEADRGELLDGEEVFAELERISAERRRANA